MTLGGDELTFSRKFTFNVKLTLIAITKGFFFLLWGLRGLVPTQFSFNSISFAILAWKLIVLSSLSAQSIKEILLKGALVNKFVTAVKTIGIVCLVINYFASVVGSVCPKIMTKPKRFSLHEFPKQQIPIWIVDYPDSMRPSFLKYLY